MIKVSFVSNHLKKSRMTSTTLNSKKENLLVRKNVIVKFDSAHSKNDSQKRNMNRITITIPTIIGTSIAY